MARRSPSPLGLQFLRLLFIVGPIVVFCVLWIIFFVRIWRAGDGPAPNLSATGLYVTSVVGGVLGTFFSVSLGIQRKDPHADVRKLRPGRTLLGLEPGTSNIGTHIATLAVWVYAGVSSFALLTVLVHEVQSPKPVKAMASAFASLVFAMFAAALAPGQDRSSA
jgi:hypothetical protein